MQFLKDWPLESNKNLVHV